MAYKKYETASALDVLSADAPDAEAFRDDVIATEAAFELIQQLARKRRALGITQHQVAERMGTSQAAVARLEQFTHDPRLTTTARYAAALDISFASLFRSLDDASHDFVDSDSFVTEIDDQSSIRVQVLSKDVSGETRAHQVMEMLEAEVSIAADQIAEDAKTAKSGHATSSGSRAPSRVGKQVRQLASSSRRAKMTRSHVAYITLETRLLPTQWHQLEALVGRVRVQRAHRTCKKLTSGVVMLKIVAADSERWSRSLGQLDVKFSMRGHANTKAGYGSHGLTITTTSHSIAPAPTKTSGRRKS